jgi:hypothetical protein
MCTYYWLALKEAQEQQQAVGEDEAAAPKRQQIHFHEIERLMKRFRTHRCALDFDRGFVNAVMRETEKAPDKV